MESNTSALKVEKKEKLKTRRALEPRINECSSCKMWGALLFGIWCLGLTGMISWFTKHKYQREHGLMYQCPTFAESDKAHEILLDEFDENNEFDYIHLFDPTECRNFYREKDEAIWFGRITETGALAQNILIYGYLLERDTFPRSTNESFKATFEYQIALRGKSMNLPGWESYPLTNHSIEVTCQPDRTVCTWFIAGWLNYVKHEMYDVAINVVKADAPTYESENGQKLDLTDLNFQIVYVNPEFTKQDMIRRMVLMGVSFIAFLIYTTKVCCRVPKKYERQVTPIQKYLCYLLFTLVLFNDPWFTVHIYAPSFWVLGLSVYQESLFFSMLMVFWLINLSKFNPKSGELTQQKNSELQKKIQQRMRKKTKCMTCCLEMLVFFLTLSFTNLYVAFYLQFDIDPGFNYTNYKDFTINTDIAVAFYVLMVIIYLVMYFCAMFSTIKHICTAKLSDQLLFWSSFCLMILLAESMIAGRFNRHFANGGVQFFAYCILNLYVIAMAVFNWPVLVIASANANQYENWPIDSAGSSSNNGGGSSSNVMAGELQFGEGGLVESRESPNRTDSLLMPQESILVNQQSAFQEKNEVEMEALDNEQQNVEEIKVEF